MAITDQLQLKAIRYSEFASQETHCYQAKLYYNDKVLAEVSNDGCGGCDRVLKVGCLDFKKSMDEIASEFLAMAPIKSDRMDFMYQPTLERWCHDEVTTHLFKQELNRRLKSPLLKTSKGRLISLRCKADSGTLTQIRAARPSDTLLNDLPFDEALKLYRKRA